MITLLRKIRKNLLGQGNFISYLIYALGEILLVVAGILIALQVNTWNENKKKHQIEIELLKGIYSDFETDLKNLDSLQMRCKLRLNHFKKIDPSFDLPTSYLLPNDTSTVIDYYMLMTRPPSYRANQGNFDALVASGTTIQVSNKNLFNKIQNIYNGGVMGTLSVYETLKTREDNLAWKRAYELKHQPYKRFDEIKDPQFIAELNYFFVGMRLYLSTITAVENKMIEVMGKLEMELNREM